MYDSFVYMQHGWSQPPAQREDVCLCELHVYDSLSAWYPLSVGALGKYGGCCLESRARVVFEQIRDTLSERPQADGS